MNKDTSVIDIEYIFNVDLTYLFKRTDVQGKAAVSRAEGIYNHNIYLHQSLPEMRFEKADDIWSLSGEPENTYKVYLYSLQFISLLNNGYEQSDDLKYLEKIEQILESWISFENNSTDKRVWYDFAVANRVIVITHYLMLCKRANYELNPVFKKKMAIAMLKNGEYLFSDEHYVDNNHGIMMDRALLQLSLFFRYESFGEKWLKKAINRLEKQIKNSFTKEYINVENSPEYHYHTYHLFEELQAFLDINKINLAENTLGYILKEIYKQHLHLLKPDLTYPLIGDTNHKYFNNGKYIPDSIVFPETGLAILKKKKSYLTLKSGFSNTSHKHFDDLSFTFSYKGTDLFIDSGKYNYDNKSKYRKYVVSAMAHNTIVVDDKNYSLNLDNQNQLGISSYHLENDFAGVEVTNNLYEDINITRRLIHIYPNLIILVDDIKSNNDHKYSQVFNLNGTLNFNAMTKEQVIGHHHKGNLKLEMNQHLPTDYISSYHGYEDEENIRGFNSISFAKLEPCYNMEFVHQKKREAKFLTSILAAEDNAVDNEVKEFTLLKEDKTNLVFSVEDNKGMLSLYHYEYTEGIKRIFDIKDILYKYSASSRELVIDMKDDTSDFEFACYLLVNNKIVKKEGYRDAIKFHFNSIPSGNISIWLFIRNKDDNDIKILKKQEISQI
ncbi:heparinase II/III domain-containing protein [Priestia aryabhattai]|uniref:heparinase II/III domain-containing protein n=1 Tax=Priestia aryabhattai TaxID=412384 RepID=UPI003A80E2D5